MSAAAIFCFLMFCNCIQCKNNFADVTNNQHLSYSSTWCVWVNIRADHYFFFHTETSLGSRRLQVCHIVHNWEIISLSETTINSQKTDGIFRLAWTHFSGCSRLGGQPHLVLVDSSQLLFCQTGETTSNMVTNTHDLSLVEPSNLVDFVTMRIDWMVCSADRKDKTFSKQSVALLWVCECKIRLVM